MNLASSRRIITSTVTRRSYREAPVSPLMLFDRQQDFAYQQEVAGSPAKRHHVRFWRCPRGLDAAGRLPRRLAGRRHLRQQGRAVAVHAPGHPQDRGRHRRRARLHRRQRDSSRPTVGVEVIENFSTGYHSRNGGGDPIQTDGNLPMVDLRPVAHRRRSARATPTAATGDRRRPSSAPASPRCGPLIYVATAWHCCCRRPIAPSSPRTRRRAASATPRGAIVGAAIFLLVGAAVDAMLGVGGARGPQLGAHLADERVRLQHRARVPRTRERRSGADPETARAGRRQHPGPARPLEPCGPRVRRAAQTTPDASGSYRPALPRPELRTGGPKRWSPRGLLRR